MLLTVWVVASLFRLSHEGRIAGCEVTTALLLCYSLHVLICLDMGSFFFLQGLGGKQGGPHYRVVYLLYDVKSVQMRRQVPG